MPHAHYAHAHHEHSHAHSHHCQVHHHDIDARLAEAVAHCQSSDARFTPLRQEVYRLILQADKPMGAYDLMTALQDGRFAEQEKKNGTAKKVNIAPPTIYRSLDFLLSQGLIHQLNSINAYVPCCHPRATHSSAFLICKNCKNVQEYSDLPIDGLIAQSQNDTGFVIEKSIIELQGLCRECQS